MPPAEALGPDLFLWPSPAGLCPEGLGWKEGEPEGRPGGICQASTGEDGVGGRQSAGVDDILRTELLTLAPLPLRPTASPAKESTPQVVRPGLQPASPSSYLTMPTKRRCSKAASTLQALPPSTHLKRGPYPGLQAPPSHHSCLPCDIGVWCCL